MTKLSVALATYNEEDHIKDCLASVKDLANEIVVVDGGSTDKTVNIAKQFGAKIIVTDNPVIFHINKNKAIDVTSGDWILQLDADERVTEYLEKEIKNKILEKSDVAGYWIPRRNFFLGKFLKKGGQYPDYTLRLYRRGKGRLPARDVHEQAIVEGNIDYLENDLLHVRDTSFSKYIAGLNRYTDIISLQLKESKLKIGVFSFINYFFIKPIFWFLKTFIRHKGYIDGFPGFIFALLSSLRFPIAYIKLYIDQKMQNYG